MADPLPKFQKARAADLFLRELAVAKREFDNAGDSGRTGAVLFLVAVRDLIENLEADHELAAPAMSMLTAFNRAEEGGGQHPLFASEGRVGRSEPVEDAEYKARAAAAMHLLMTAGENKAEAAQKVARFVNKWPLPGARAVTGKKVARWRDHIASGDPAKLATALYRLYTDTSKLGGVSAAGEIAASLLEGGPRWRPKSHKPLF